MKKNQNTDEREESVKVEKIQNNKNQNKTLFETIKSKLIEMGVEYVKTNIEQSKNAIFGFIEKNIERRIRKEIRRYQFLLLSSIILLIGILFMLYAAFQFIAYIANLPLFLTNLIFGFFLILIGSIIYAINK